MRHGRGKKRAGPGAPVPAAMSSVGMTILPGVPMPEWADPTPPANPEPPSQDAFNQAPVADARWSPDSADAEFGALPMAPGSMAEALAALDGPQDGDGGWSSDDVNAMVIPDWAPVMAGSAPEQPGASSMLGAAATGATQGAWPATASDPVVPWVGHWDSAGGAPTPFVPTQGTPNWSNVDRTPVPDPRVSGPAPATPPASPSEPAPQWMAPQPLTPTYSQSPVPPPAPRVGRHGQALSDEDSPPSAAQPQPFAGTWGLPAESAQAPAAPSDQGHPAPLGPPIEPRLADLSPEQYELVLRYAPLVAATGVPTAAVAPPKSRRKGVLRRKQQGAQQDQPREQAVDPQSAGAGTTAVTTTEAATAASFGAPVGSPLPAGPSQPAPTVPPAPAQFAPAPLPAAPPSADLPPGGPARTAPNKAPKQPKRKGRGVKLALAGAVTLVVGGAAFLGASHFLGGDSGAPVAPTTLSLPATTIGYQQADETAASAAVTSEFGLPLKPSGATVTGAYAAKAGGPVALTLMATIAPRPAAPQQFAAFAERTGTKVGKPVVGAGSAAGTTCADVTPKKGSEIPAGVLCVWDAGSLRGQAYFKSGSVKQAGNKTALIATGLAG